MAKNWIVKLYLRDDARNTETGETFRHLSKKQITNVIIDKLDLPAAITLTGSFTEED